MIEKWTEKECVEAAVSKLENQYFDRKNARVSYKDVGNLIIAMANADGGLIAIGVDDDGKISGFSGLEGNAKDLEESVLKWVLPPVRYQLRFVPCKKTDGSLDRIALIDIPQSELVHENSKGECYLRIGTETRLLSYEERGQLLFDKGQAVFEGEVVDGVTLDNLDAELISDLGAQLRIDGDEKVLRAMHLVEDRGGAVVLNYAGFLLFGKTPQTKLPKATIRVIKIDGTELETGDRYNVIKDETFDGNLVRQLSRATAFIQSNLRDFSVMNKSGKFVTTPEYPRFAWLEALVNAVVHRSYSLAAGASIQVRMFRDHFEVESPGNLPHTIRLDNILKSRYSRNPRIAMVFYRFGIVRELGEGMDRMFSEMSKAGLPTPEIKTGPGESRVVLVLRNNIASRKEAALSHGKINLEKIGVLTPDELKIITFAAENGKITSGECRDILGVSPQTAISRLAALVDRGVLVDNRFYLNDPKAFYTINKDLLLT